MSTVNHPWRVEYFPKRDEWHPKSMPCVVDSTGRVVVTPQQYVDHPGKRDIVAETVCKLIIAAVNEYIERRK